MRRLTYFIAVSIDGFIGAPDGEAEFFTHYLDEEFIEYLKTEYPETLPSHIHEPLGLGGFEKKQFDVVVQGRVSYELALDIGIASPYAHLHQLVASRSIGEAPDPAVEIVSDDLVGRIRELKQEDGLGIYLCGGSRLAGELLDEIDDLVIKTYPIVLGSGMPMFASGFRLTDFALGSVRTFGNGVLVRKYSRKR